MDLGKFQNIDIVLVCGLPGSGKSHFARAFFLKSGRKRVNRKEIRRHLFEMTSFGQKWTEAEFAGNDEFLVRHVEKKIVEHFLQNHQKLLLDNTNISVESRKPYLAIAHQTGKSIGVVFLNTPVSQCLQRNRGREDAVPESLIAQLQAEKEIPELSEGYREVLVIDSYYSHPGPRGRTCVADSASLTAVRARAPSARPPPLKILGRASTFTFMVMPENPRAPRTRLRGIVHSVENAFSPLLLLLITLVLAITIIARLFGVASLRASNDYIRHLVLWIAFAGAMITTREKNHLSLSVGVERIPERIRRWVTAGTSFISAAICSAQAVSALSFILTGFAPGARVGVLPTVLATVIMPLGYAFMTVRFIVTPAAGAGRRWIAFIGVPAGLFLAWSPLATALLSILPAASPAAAWLGGPGQSITETAAAVFSAIHLPLVFLLLASVLLGGPIFVLVGGLALLFFQGSGGALETAANQAYTMLTGDVIPSIPLFTLAGYIISEGKSGERLVRLFRAVFGRLPGGLALMSILICAFLTTFTGASGVTIIAVGTLLLFVLKGSGYDERFGRGLITASGSIGLLFPPSLPVILYGVVSMTNIKQMFVGGILPGIFLVLSIATLGVWRARKDRVPRVPFELREVLPALWRSLGEILLPVLILVLFLKGITTLVETGAVAVIYAIVLEVVIHRDLKLQQLPAVFLKSVVILGGILIILASAAGFSYYIVDAQIPVQLTQWLRAHVTSPYVFLILLNLVLLVKGFFIDIFSAITIVVPLIAPLGAAYGINPVHLGVIFLANLELGYLTPPLGLNLFLASYRFEKPVIQIYRDVLPFQLVMLVAVLIITYVPWMTTALLNVIKF